MFRSLCRRSVIPVRRSVCGGTDGSVRRIRCPGAGPVRHRAPRVGPARGRAARRDYGPYGRRRSEAVGGGYGASPPTAGSVGPVSGPQPVGAGSSLIWMLRNAA